MISADVPLILAKACEIFIEEMTTRAWDHATDAKRKTLRKEDISTSCGDSDMYDFLIDIVPRDLPRHRQHKEASPPQEEGGEIDQTLSQLRPDNPDLAPYFEQVKKLFGMSPEQYIEAFKQFIKQPEIRSISAEDMQTRFAHHLSNIHKQN
jgi:hypothetical protein